MGWLRPAGVMAGTGRARAGMNPVETVTVEDVRETDGTDGHGLHWLTKVRSAPSVNRRHYSSSSHANGLWTSACVVGSCGAARTGASASSSNEISAMLHLLRNKTVFVFKRNASTSDVGMG
ncbi:hypothetical protein Francci3_4237 [Frankia casuarinae]|uniref:Uncharacterized protein n=1 Tax=Frankia casuarinae (strain DSM 45818 / CECT 9043 / HFP020203 / CcI3) TaxID=106370 RepID=Q2J559_FRACC|nr:hypothetical protein Francci3_4237 [Frankia casuarinae]